MYSPRTLEYRIMPPPPKMCSICDFFTSSRIHEKKEYGAIIVSNTIQGRTDRILLRIRK